MKTSTFAKDIDRNISENSSVYRRLQINYQRNRKQDCTELIDAAARAFCYQDCQDKYWQSEEFSLLYGTALWESATTSQKLILNHLYWVAYYCQIISAEIATIYFNQTSAAGLYAEEDFRLVCDMLDLESSQERAHIHAFKTIAEQVEKALFGKRIFTYPMRSPFAETMVFADTNPFKSRWKQLQLQSFGMLSAGNSFLACQYFTVRGIRTLNGKLVQHKLSNFYHSSDEKKTIPIPSQISYYHFLDESFHFNSSTIISHDVINCLKPPTKFETWVANLGIKGCQQDHYHFSAAINGIFWYDPALYRCVYEILRSPIFSCSNSDAKQMMNRCFTEESEGLHRSFQTHFEAVESYKAYLEPLTYIWKSNREMSTMSSNSIEKYLKRQKKALSQFMRINDFDNY
ncbi:P-aminobenzoate N-oxygenase AurF [Merismopedia glauca]|uniref:p-aminobenzoate N-oxygenase AurF n=1 Tax=Merismopedia glauca CCAP 1448/3 TaxID=1296344 RepID=A0A2T1C6X1_9CYAN|nr:P-aminobenzoate N-oxygenase AurF [Merismopedia glauca]PSB03893.1 P-aminobenzoate N-oxygenase AurF [Merismopedia glauca CCAP 1448/3]